MKIFVFCLLGTVSLAICGCKKIAKHSTTPAESINFELLDKNNQSLIHSLMDSVKVSYVLDGITKYQELNVKKLKAASGDTTTSSKYNGLVINDEKFMSVLSIRNENPIHDFKLYLNGKSLGNVFIEYWNALETPFGGTTKYFTLNGMSATVSYSSEYVIQGSGMFLLTVQ